MRTFWKTPSIRSFFALLIPALVFAPIGYSAEDADDISLRVARISYVEGNATMLRFNDQDWTDATLNTPLMAGDKIYTGIGSRAEIQLQDQTVVRLGSDTFVTFEVLDDALGRINISKGAVNVYAEDVNYNRPPLEIFTPNVSAAVVEFANVRVTAPENAPTELIVRRGEVQVIKNEKETYALTRGNQLIASNPDHKSHQIVPKTADDTFDQWGDVRDAMNTAVTTSRYVTPRVSGYADLDYHGEWVNTSDYGRVWRPRTVASDWAPYRDGRWIWREPYGYIWVSYEPWGWTPYHYGRWVYVRNYNWCWVPSEVVYIERRYPRPVWHPALVSFTYAKRGRYFSLSIGRGYYDSPCVGWFPLGPSDPYCPWYDYRSVYIHHDRYYYRPRHSVYISYGYYPKYYHRRHPDYGRTTIINGDVTIVNNYNYQNQNIDNAVTVTSRDDFESGVSTRLTAATIDRKPEPELQVGASALPVISERRDVVSKPRRVGETTASSVTSTPAANVDVSPAAEPIRSDGAVSRPLRVNENTGTAVTPQTEGTRESGSKPRRVESEQSSVSPSSEAQTQSRASRPTRAGVDTDGTVNAPTTRAERPRSDTVQRSEPRAVEPRTGSSSAEREQPRTVERPRSTDSGARLSPFSTGRQENRSVSQPRTESPARSSDSGSSVERPRTERPSVSQPRESASPSTRNNTRVEREQTRQPRAAERPRSTDTSVELSPYSAAARSGSYSAPRTAQPAQERTSSVGIQRYNASPRSTDNLPAYSSLRSSSSNRNPGVYRLDPDQQSNRTSPVRVYGNDSRQNTNSEAQRSYDQRYNTSRDSSSYSSPRSAQPDYSYSQPSYERQSPSYQPSRSYDSGSSSRNSPSRYESSSNSRSSVSEPRLSSPRSSSSYNSSSFSSPSRSSSFSSPRSSGSFSSNSRSSAPSVSAPRSSGSFSSSRSSGSASISAPRSSGSVSSPRSSVSSSPRSSASTSSPRTSSPRRP